MIDHHGHSSDIQGSKELHESDEANRHTREAYPASSACHLVRNVTNGMSELTSNRSAQRHEYKKETHLQVEDMLISNDSVSRPQCGPNMLRG